MLDNLGKVVRLQGMEHVEEVLPWRSLSLRVLVREVRLEVWVLLHRWIDVLDRQLFIMRNFDGDDVNLLEQLLLPGEHGLDKVLGHDGLVRQVELD